MKAMILAAGLGTRLRPITENIPKALIPINDTPLLELVIIKLISSGFNDIIINVHHHARQIINFIEQKNHFGINITISDESEELLETGGGLKKASWFFDDKKPFLVYNVDIISDIDLKKLYKFHTDSDALITLAVKNRKSVRYLLFDSTNSLCGWKNLQTGETKIIRNVQSKIKALAFSGIHVINPEAFNYINPENYFSLTDFYIKIAGNHKIQAFNHVNTKWIDIGKIECLEMAKKMV
jgi:NDP-sugar pyrophosphorylase family protein